jgi:hypothetical protein
MSFINEDSDVRYMVHGFEDEDDDDFIEFHMAIANDDAPPQVPLQDYYNQEAPYASMEDISLADHHDGHGHRYEEPPGEPVTEI